MQKTLKTLKTAPQAGTQNLQKKAHLPEPDFLTKLKNFFQDRKNIKQNNGV